MGTMKHWKAQARTDSGCPVIVWLEAADFNGAVAWFKPYGWALDSLVAVDAAEFDRVKREATTITSNAGRWALKLP